MRVISGLAAERRTTPLEDAYAHFRLDRQGLPVSAATLRLYEHTIGRFLRWVREEHADVRRFEDLDVVVVRQYRAAPAARPGLRGRPIQPETLSGSDRALRTFFRWASAEGYPVADRILALPKVRVPWKEPTLFHIRQLREILAACNPRLPQEALAVRLLVGAGVRRLELCGLAVEGPDGLPDLTLDSLDRGIVELRVRGETGAKGMRARRVPVVPKLGAEVKRYVARHRPEVAHRNLWRRWRRPCSKRRCGGVSTSSPAATRCRTTMSASDGWRAQMRPLQRSDWWQITLRPSSFRFTA